MWRGQDKKLYLYVHIVNVDDVCLDDFSINVIDGRQLKVVPYELHHIVKWWKSIID